VGLRAGLDAVLKRKISSPLRDKIKIDFKYMGFEDVDWIHLVQ
jgi:hypothetical protein